MQPQPQPRRTHAFGSEPISPPHTTPKSDSSKNPPLPSEPIEEIDFYALRRARIESAALAAPGAVSTPPLTTPRPNPKSRSKTRPQSRTNAPQRRVRSRGAQSRGDQLHQLSPHDEQRFERLIEAKPERVPLAPCHWGLLVVTLLLVALSLPFVYSASAASALDNHHPDFFLTRQIGYAALGLMLMVGLSRLAPAKVRGALWTLYGVALVGLLLTKFTPLGHAMGNTERWMKIGPVTFQFSELMKVALVGVLADFWSRVSPRDAAKLWPWATTAALSLIPAALVFLQPHMSATIILLIMPFIVLFFAGASGTVLSRILTPIFLAGLLVVWGCKTHSVPFLPHYQQDRIAAKFAGGDERGNEYQSLQGQRAIIRGGLTGVGVGASLYKQGHLPAPHTDFIFSIIAEETGFWGSALLIGLYGAVVFFCFQIGFASRDLFRGAFCAGVGALIALQVAWNLLIMVGWAPVTGMPLPIITYGGSGLWCVLTGLGLVLALSRDGVETA